VSRQQQAPLLQAAGVWGGPEALIGTPVGGSLRNWPQLRRQQAAHPTLPHSSATNRRAASVCVCAGHRRQPAGAAADACEPRFNWFPTAAEIGEDIVINNKTCSGKQVCNFPNVWHKANQTAYMAKLATDLNRGLLNVALKQYGNQPPRLFFTPVSEFLEAGADVSPCANSRKPATTRHLLARAKVCFVGGVGGVGLGEGMRRCGGGGGGGVRVRVWGCEGACACV
jgi:hypothetical protein